MAFETSQCLKALPPYVFVTIDELKRKAVARGADEADVRRRAAAQADREVWLLWADDVIVNEGTKEELAAQVRALWDRLVGE
ncbi:MAG: dephospho-CoA kinase [Acidobacteria bacterium]|nr:dephospho-CoA kinase [Acidobacteriota bacterium]